MSKAPLRIGIIGAQGSGKSKLSRALAKESESLLGHKPVVVDNYAQKLQRDTGLALGMFATYSENFMVAGARHAAEYKAINTGKSVITVGTMIETFLYGVMTSDAEMQRFDPQGAMQVASAGMTGLGVFFGETFDYDAVIYLPYVEKKGYNQWSKLFDSHIESVAFNFSVPISIIRGTDSERVSRAQEVVRYAYEKAPEAPVSVESPVGESGEDRS